MPKLHTRQKRMLRMKSVKSRKRKTRPKTFRTEDAAKRYAEAKGMKGCKIVNMRPASQKRHKFRAVSQ